MENFFAVKSDHLSLYEAFKMEAEKLGWVYLGPYNDDRPKGSYIREQDFLACSALYFDAKWTGIDVDPKFTFSNISDETVCFQLPGQWAEALGHMKTVLTEATKTHVEQGRVDNKPYVISLREVAMRKNIPVENIQVIY